MNEEQHIIKFKHTYSLHKKLDIDDDFYINSYNKLSKNRQEFINISYFNLDVYSSIPSNNYNYIINLSNMLYKLHTPYYYSRIQWNKELI